MVEMNLLFVLHPHQNGWRWAIMRANVAELMAEPTQRCINAAHVPDGSVLDGLTDTKTIADKIGQHALYTLLHFGHLCGVNFPVESVTLDYDPITSPAPSLDQARWVTGQIAQL